MNHPIIGIVGRVEDDYISIKKSYVWNAVIKYGGIPFLILPVSDDLNKNLISYDYSDDVKNKYDKILDICDGFIVPGGNDYYDVDMYVINYAYLNNKSLLGICLGMQVMSIWDSKIDISEIGNDSHLSSDYYVHSVNIDNDSYLYKILGTSLINVNSRHSYKVSCVNKLNVGAKASDGIIEEIEDLSKKFFIGVQWHPEDIDDIYSERLFKEFILESSS